VIIRGGYRLIPWWVRRAVYRPILSRGGGHPAEHPPEPAEGDYAAGPDDGATTNSAPDLPVSS